MTTGAPSRQRRVVFALAAILAMQPAALLAKPALREMQIHKVPALGLEIWVENQPAWDAKLVDVAGHPTFVAQSPSTYHPPTVMTYASWPKLLVTPNMLPDVAASAIRQASQHFGLDPGRGRMLTIKPASHGALQGFEADFAGKSEGVAMDVRIFVGQAPGQFPVALTVTTLPGKMAHLEECIRRGWGRLNYAGAVSQR
ncbi:hypothetical protein [Actimicrobium sp. CCI2.3]|uniref:hypothetical protein n=1 Tax=Actimicrobium sp. CCI2.3 TaxID=3048616 RepID=UPI002AB33764|nr:hypothetical protein [Actimicrobium sp. CCI2.3]MDY7575711.1 hypothetical protein [Actimicrobium sp. CCI2.3]MEB0024149.1 hypothetical protein [Actimicrobium sp. CCI2.3]